MDLEEIEYLFDEKYLDDYLKFEKVENKLSNHPDLHAMILLDRLFPTESSDKTDMVGGAGYDEVFLSIEGDDFAKKATEELILELVRCGIGWQDESLHMFV